VVYLRELSETAILLNGHCENRLPNMLSLSFHRMEANVLLAEISNEVAVSAGAACHAGATEISAVLKAMSIPVDWAMSTMRFSVGQGTTSEEINRTIRVVARAVRLLRPEA